MAEIIISLNFTVPSNTTIQLPLTGTGLTTSTNWGDGNTDASLNHTYTIAGTHTVVVSLTGGSYSLFGYGEDIWDGSEYLTSINSWGNNFTGLGGACANATILTNVPTTLPTSVTILSYMFTGASIFNQDISTWNTTNVINMQGMFQLSMFDQPIGSWNTANVTDMTAMFALSQFNQDISGWDTSKVTLMVGMFYNSVKFNQDISRWNISNVTDMSGMLDNCGLSVTNYDALLNGWATQSVKSGVTLGADGLVYSAAGRPGRNILINPPNNWTIVGDSGPPNPPQISFPPAQQPATVTPYPSNQLHRATSFKTMFDTTFLPYNKMYNNCSNTLCYNYSKNYIYKPHSGYGMVGTTAAAYRGRRKKL